MATILDLPKGTTLEKNDFLHGVQGGVDKRFTFEELPVATENSNGLMSAADKRNMSRKSIIYTQNSGILIKTNVDDNSNEMFLLEITVNRYGEEIPSKTIIQGYNYSTGKNIIECKGAIICGTPVNVKCFIFDSFLCFFIDQNSAYQTFKIEYTGFDTINNTKYNSFIASVENAVMPTNVSRLVEVIPISSGVRSFSANQLTVSLSNTNPILPPPRKFRTNQQRIRQLFPGICEEYRDTG